MNNVILSSFVFSPTGKKVHEPPLFLPQNHVARNPHLDVHSVQSMLSYVSVCNVLMNTPSRPNSNHRVLNPAVDEKRTKTLLIGL